MIILYNIAFSLFCLFYLPTFFLKKKSHDHLWERFGSIPSPKKEGNKLLWLKEGKKIFWLHTVSLGESLAAVALIEEIRRRFPNIQFAFSTTTRTGRAVLEKIRKEGEILFYFPLDLSWVTRRVVQKLEPDIFATVETEIWPNLILALKQKNVPILLLNGRISKQSFRRYRWIRWAIREALRGIDLFCMQYPEDGERIRNLGGDPEKIHIVGNMKFDLSVPLEGTSSHEVRRRLGLKEEEMLWVAGSTHPGEEKSILEIYQVLSRTDPHLRLLIAPRHPERTQEVVGLIGAFHRPTTLFSEN